MSQALVYVDTSEVRDGALHRARSHVRAELERYFADEEAACPRISA
jgi:hypothetical protein